MPSHARGWADHPVMRWVDRYKWALTLLYVPVFLTWFFVLEHRPDGFAYVMYSPLDDLIPFREEFILAYATWFPYLIGFAAWLFVRDKQRSEYPRAFYMLVTGMTTCLAIYTFWPNTQNLRPTSYPRQNVFTSVVAALQGFDSPSDVCPSLHVYTTLVVNHCLQKSELLRHSRGVRAASWVLCVLISASTVFLKQHSIVDVFAALALYLAIWGVGHVIARRLALRRNTPALP